ncbi:MAG: TetR/AcrR family transcriptional regulator, partial [Leucobacter sp.]
QVAVGVFNEHGYDATSVGVLASRLGLSKSAIYHHFSSKDELLSVSLDRALGALERARDSALAEGGSAADQLEAVLRGAVHALVAELPHVTLLLRVRGNTDVERDAMKRRRAFDRSMRALVVAAADEGSLREGVGAGLAERLLFGMINSIAEWYRPEHGDTADVIADHVVGLAMSGLFRG